MDFHRKLFFIVSLAVFLNNGYTKDILQGLNESETYDDLTSKDYRLPNSMHPTSYEINLFPKLMGDFSFRGEVKINVTVDEPTKLIVLHYGNLLNVNTSVSAKDIELDIEKTSYDNETEKYSIELKETLEKGNEIVLSFTYDSFLRNDMIGFYKSSYITEDNTIQWLAATQFETTHARHAFPCFDEPGFKATFKISLTRSEKLTSISNMPLESTQKISSDLYQDSFRTTVPMSTYLVAFTIFDFAKNSSGLLRVWARAEIFDQTQYALKIGSDALTYLTKLFDQQYELPKMDMVAIPDFSAGAMENWGLITYRESRMLYDEKECSVVDQQNVASVIIHEITHMWFGNLLTPSWWSYLWLSEGFARYFQYFGTDKIENTWSMEGQFLVEQHQAALGVDGMETSQSMTRIVNNRSQIAGIGDSITYAKGASVIRMMSHIIGIYNFHEALRLYVRQSKSMGIVEPENLWLAFQDVVDSSDIVIETIMNNWTREPGFPVLTVTIEKGKATLHQKRFLLQNLKSTPVNTNWWIPITYTTKKQTNFGSTNVKHWMKDEKETIAIDASDSDWVVFNIQQTGFYRVNYDNASWYRIIDALKSNSFTKIHKYNRAGIIDDLLNLARAGLLDYRTALDGLQYLQQEKNYLPFKAAFRALDYLTQRFSGHEADYNLYKKHVLSLIENVYEGLGYTDRKNDDRLKILLRRELNNLACKFGHEECVFNSLEFFRNWITSRNRIEPNQRSAAYCMGILHGNFDDWERLWNHYKTSKVVSEQVVILNALACSNDTDILQQYLRYAISPYEVNRIRKQDSTSVFTVVYSSSLIGINSVLDFVDKNHDLMAKYYGSYDTIASILSGASRYLSTQELIDKFEKLIKKHSEFSKMKSLMNSLELAKYELNWYKNNADSIISWINDNSQVSDDPINEYRLPRNVIPNKYILSLEPFFKPNNFTFNGNVQIVASVVKRTNEIVLHASDITVHSVDVSVNNEKVKVTEIKQGNYDFLTIKLENALNKKTEVSIVLRYAGKLNDKMEGFYRSYYIDSHGKQRWLAVTQMEPIGARKMLPCFDEPAMKAVFTLDVMVPNGYHAISNANIKEVRNYTDIGKNLYRFENTELMSTYLLALVVSDFNYVQYPSERNYTVWFRPNSFNETSYSLSVMEPLVKTYEEILKHNYILNKLEMVALPDLEFGAMENLGLLTFRERYLLLDSSKSNIRSIQTGTNIISHEIAHQWFGNLVTPLWWKYIWLNEGFATYFEYFGTSYIQPEWELEWQFVVNELHTAFQKDALTSSHPMTNDVSNPTKIKDIFDKITYAKAASVIRMIEKTYGKDVFYAALQNYLEARKYNVATPEDLYKAFSSQLSDEIYANRASKFFNSWTTQAGFPIVDVKIDSNGQATLSQERFFLRNEKGESIEKIWQIPITWTSEKNPNFTNTKPQFWFNHAQMTAMTDDSEGWKIFNVQQAGYYRVNYDIANWKSIINALNKQKFEKIHKVNRAAIIDDLMNLARAGYVDYDLFFSATEYLQYEKDYLPWRAFSNGLTYLHNKFEGKEIFEFFKKYVVKLVDSVIKTSSNNESHVSDLLRMELFKWACKYESHYCYIRSTIYLNQILPNSRPSVYCALAKLPYRWEALWNLYLNSNITSDKYVILNALGCSELPYHINKLLTTAITKYSSIRYRDSTAVFTSVYENSLIGVETVMKFMENKFNKIYKYYEDKSAIQNIMGGLAERISTIELYEQYKYLTEMIVSKIPTLQNSLQSYNDLILYELDWYKKNIPKISYWLETHYHIDIYRLPTTVYPLNYNLSIALNKNIFFNGTVKINIQIDKPTFKIILNSYNLDIIRMIVYETPTETSHEDLKYFHIMDYALIQESQQLIIYFSTHIEVPKVTVEIEYSGIFNKEMKGLYLARYEENNHLSTYLATYFKPNYARMVFPCFDEPAFKAKFKIHILRDNSYKTLSNMPLERSVLAFPNSQNTWDIYKESPNMSTYLLAFVVSNFVSIKIENEKFNVWGRKGIIHYGNEVYNAAYKYYHSMNRNLLDINELEKLDLVGLPDYPIGAMENWGLFTFRESQLFYDKNIIPLSQQYSILTTISHEMSHRYFGNLVTCEWWNYTWLNEGFAQYFQWLLLKAIGEDEFISHFMVNDMHEVFEVDGFIYSHPLNYPVSEPNQLRKPFDKISYKKGASIIRMLHMLIGDQDFYYILKKYLKNNEYGTVNPEKLWNELEGYIGSTVPLEITMDAWVNKPGYPVVTVSYMSGLNAIRITQERFLYYTYDGPSHFHIPITMATKHNPNFNNTSPQFWLTDTESTFKFDLKDQWIILNVQQIGYYRVSYDDMLMKRIITLLHSSNYTMIHVINRAQIIDDAFSLARSRNTYYMVLKLALYLSQEKEYLPWKAFERGINNLWERIRHSVNTIDFQKYVLYLTEKHVERLGFDDLDSDDLDSCTKCNKENQLIRELILSLNCKFGGQTCIEKSKELVMDYPQFRTISRNAKPALLCAGIKNSKTFVWTNLWFVYEETKLHAEQILYLDALGCTEDDINIDQYLQYIFDKNGLRYIRKQDISRAFASIYKSSYKGWIKCYEYLINHYKEIYNLFGNWKEVGALFYEIVIRIPDTETFDKFIIFKKENEKILEPILPELYEAIQIAEKMISTNQQLPLQIQSVLEKLFYYFQVEYWKNSNSGPSNLNTVFLLTIISLISFLLFK